MSEDTAHYKTAEWFQSLHWQHQWIDKMAGWWVGAFGLPKTVLDLGAGDGWWCKAFHDMGSAVWAVELYEEAREFIPQQVQFIQHDLTELGNFWRAYDLVICLEVAEHIPRPAAGMLIQNIARHAGDDILFSSAPPGQDGTGHINLQPQKYWRDQFSGYRCELNANKTGQTREAFEHICGDKAFSFLPKNIQVFSRLIG